MTFGDKASQAFGAVHEVIVAAGIATALKRSHQYFADCAQASAGLRERHGTRSGRPTTDDELAACRMPSRRCPREIPATTEEIAAVAEGNCQSAGHQAILVDLTEAPC